MASMNLFNDKDVENLKEIKRLLQEIKELDLGFNFSNVIESNDTTILVFTTEGLWRDIDLNKYEEILTDKLQCKSIILRNGFKLDKAVEKENKKIDYETNTFYADGEVIREETIQYK